jgi:hyperosmotically inducible protein
VPKIEAWYVTCTDPIAGGAIMDEDHGQASPSRLDGQPGCRRDKHRRSAMLVRTAASLLLVSAPAFAADPDGARRSPAGVISDAWTTARVKLRLIADPGIAPLTMNVDTRNGVVTLFGSISTEDGKRAAGAEAMQVTGVKEVENELQVVSKLAAAKVDESDGQIRDSVEQRLADRQALDDGDIDVEVANGVVRLSGSVEQPGDRTIALSLARSTEGVRSVVDGLRVQG